MCEKCLSNAVNKLQSEGLIPEGAKVKAQSIAPGVGIIMAEVKKTEHDLGELPMIALRDIGLNEPVYLDKDVRFPTKEEFEKITGADEDRAFFNVQVDKLYEKMTGQKPTKQDRNSDAWKHAENLVNQGITADA